MMGTYSHLKFEWCGEILATIGYGVQARAILRPLIEGGADVKLIQAEDYVPAERKLKDPFWEQAIADSGKKPDMPVRINFSIPAQYRIRENCVNVGWTQWDTSKVPVEWIPVINKMDHLFCNSAYAKRSFESTTPPKHLVRPNFVFADPTNVVSVNECTTDVVKFVFSCNWLPRKNHADLITAFTYAFNDIHKDVHLILKCWPGSDDVQNKRNIENGIRHFSDRIKGLNRANVSLIFDYTDEATVDGLINFADVYVSLSKAEGLDSSMLKAMSLNKLVVGLPFDTRGDFLNAMTGLPCHYTLSPIIDSFAQLADSYQVWAQPDILDAAAKLRIAYDLVKANRLGFTEVGGSLLDYKALTHNAYQNLDLLVGQKLNTPRIAKAIEKVMP